MAESSTANGPLRELFTTMTWRHSAARPDAYGQWLFEQSIAELQSFAATGLIQKELLALTSHNIRADSLSDRSFRAENVGGRKVADLFLPSRWRFAAAIYRLPFTVAVGVSRVQAPGYSGYRYVMSGSSAFGHPARLGRRCHHPVSAAAGLTWSRGQSSAEPLFHSLP